MALVLTREEGQSVRIGDGRIVTVRTIKGGRVRLDIEAPAGEAIVRTELEDGRQARTLDVPRGRVRRYMRDLPANGEELGKALGGVVDVTG